MNDLKPNDLTEPQWFLLNHLHQYSGPFYTEFLYTQFSKHQIERLPFYMMFFSLAALSYIQLDGHGKLVPGHKQDFCYVVTPKGKKVIARYTKAKAESNDAQPVSKIRTNGIIAASFARTVRLKDYSMSH